MVTTRNKRQLATLRVQNIEERAEWQSKVAGLTAVIKDLEEEIGKMRGDRIFLMAMIEDVLGKVDPATVVWSHDGKPTLRITPDQAVVLFRNIGFEINEDTTKESLVILRELGQIIAKPLQEPRVVAKPAPGNSKVVAKEKATAAKKPALNNEKAIVEEEAAAVKKPVPDNTAATPKNEATSSDPGTLNIVDIAKLVLEIVDEDQMDH